MSTQEQTTFTSHTADWYRACRHTAVVAGVFSALVVVLLCVNYLRLQHADPLAPARLTTLKTQLVQEPDNAQLKEEIRRVDLLLRKEYYRDIAFAGHGAYLLLAGWRFSCWPRNWPGICAGGFPTRKPCRGDPTTLRLGRQAVAIFGAFTGGVLLLGLVLARHDVGAGYAAFAVPVAKAGNYPTAAELAKNWPRFRGADGVGVAPAGDWPAQWDGAKGTQILWKTALPLHGENSPVVWGDAVFLSGADEHQREIYCFDANTGKLRWRQPVNDISCADQTPLNVTDDTGYAAPTMTTDGKHVFAMFANGDLACYDFSGKRAWAQNMGRRRIPTGRPPRCSCTTIG